MCRIISVGGAPCPVTSRASGLRGREEGRGATREASGICSYEQDQEKSSGKSSRCLFSLGTPRIGQLQPTYNYVFCKAKWPNLRLFSAASSSSWKNQQSINLLQLFCFSCCDSVICSKALLVREGPHNNSLMPFPIRLFPPFCWQMRRRTSLSFQVQHFCFLHNGIHHPKIGHIVGIVFHLSRRLRGITV